MTADGWGFASDLEDISGAVAVAGVGESEHSNASGRTAREIAAQAVERALADAGLEPAEVDGIMYTPFGEPFDVPPELHHRCICLVHDLRREAYH